MRWTGQDIVLLVFMMIEAAANRRLEDEEAIVIGSIEDLVADCRSAKIDTVFITLSLAAEARIRLLTEKLADTTASVYLVPDLFYF